MTQRTLLRLAWRSILKNKMRTLLTMLGIVIGVGAVIVMVAVGQGARSQIEAQISSLGTNLIMVLPGSTAQGGVSQGAATFNRLSIEDAEKLKSEGTTFAAVSPVVQTRLVVIGPQGNWRTSINGVAADYFTIRDWTATSGEIFSDADVKSGRKIAVGRDRGEAALPRTGPDRRADPDRACAVYGPGSGRGERPECRRTGPGRHHPDALHHGADAPQRQRAHRPDPHQHPHTG